MRLRSLFLFVIALLVSNLQAQQVQSRMVEAKLLIMNESSNGFVYGTTGFDLDMNGKLSSEEYFIGNIGTKIVSIDLAKLLIVNLPKATNAFASGCIKSLYGIIDSQLSQTDNLALAEAIGNKGAMLSLKGIHPLKSKGIYFVPDGTGNVAKNPTIITFFKSGIIWELNYGMPSYYKVRLSDGQYVFPRNSRFYEDGQIAAIDCDSRYFFAEKNGRRYKLSGASWTSDGVVLSMRLAPDEQIEVEFPNGQIARNPEMISYASNFPSLHNTQYINKTLCYAVFRAGNESEYTLPNGQTIQGNLRSIRFYDSGELLGVHLHNYGESIHWLLPAGSPVSESIPYIRKLYWEPGTEIDPKGKKYEEDKILDILGGAGFTKDGRIIGFRQDYNGY